MTIIPHILEPSAITRSHTLDTSKSRFRTIFNWTKSSSGSLKPDTCAGDEAVDDDVPGSSSRPGISSRSRSENIQGRRSIRLHNSEGRRSQKTERIITDPPPLAQAYRQALLHATLETPVSFSQKSCSRQGSPPPHNALTDGLVSDVVEVKRSHKRTDSGQSDCSTKAKVFLLIHGPHLLQYNADHESDSLPEKILVLDRTCTAFACDTVPGRPWVLQISKTVHPRGQTLRPSWSRLTLRQSEEKRTVNTVLLVFDESEGLYTWLHAVRREIEQMGGNEYYSDSIEDDKTWREDLTKKFDPASEARLKKSKSMAGRTLSPVTSSYNKIYGSFKQRDHTRPKSLRSSPSSKRSVTSLDRLRDSVTSDGYTSTLATGSGNCSAPSTSPSCEFFPSISSVTSSLYGHLSLRAYSPGATNTQQQPTRASTKSRILERRKLSVNSLRLSHPNEPIARKTVPDPPSPVSGSSDDSIRAGILNKHLAAREDDKVIMSMLTSEGVGSTESTGLSAEKGVSLERKPSLMEPTNEPQKAKYSLFPVRAPTEASKEPLMSPTSLSQPQTQDQTSDLPLSHPEAIGEVRPRQRKARSKTVTLELRQHRVSALLAAGHYDLPQRSPAVTDDMIMSNFGVKSHDPPPSPVPEIKVPGLADLKIDLDFLRVPYAERPRKPTQTALESRRSSNAKSISSMHSDTSASLARAPSGPPPLGPLPAVPPIVSRKPSSHGRGSQHTSQANIEKHHKEKPTTSITPPSYNTVVEETRNKHRRTISSSFDGPPPPVRKSSDQSRRSRSRSHNRVLRKSNK